MTRLLDMTPSADRMEEWMLKIRASDEQAFASLFRSLQPALLSYTQTFVSEGADDIVQDAFVWLWENRSTLDPEPSIRAYLFTAVRNRALNRMRNDSRRRELIDHVPAPQRPARPDTAASLTELKGAMRQWIDALPARRREAFELSRFSQLTYQEIASVMGISQRTVETHIRRALQHLRDQLCHHQPDLLP